MGDDLLNSGGLQQWAWASLLLGLRVAPVFALAPPFTLTRVPPLFRVLLALGLSGMLSAADRGTVGVADFGAGWLVAAAMRELFLGTVVVLAFQLAFGALFLAGRTVDIQAGFGLAGVIDPSTRNQSPLVGTLFALAAATIFFAMNGHHDLLRLFAASLEAVPLGTASPPDTLERLFAYAAAVFIVALGVAGALMLGLFLADLAIAMMSRTMPQMNVLVLGFQVKTLLLLALLPVAFGAGAAVLTRLMSMTLQALPGLL